MRGVAFKSIFPDMSSHQALGTILRWCDISQVAVFSAIPNATIHEDLKKFWAQGAVQRRNMVEMLVTGEEWRRLIDVNASGKVTPSVTRVGRTSWVVNSSVETAEGVALARVSTVMVAVDATDSSKPVPVPHAEALKGIVAEAPTVDVAPVCPRPSGAFTWRTQVRQSDCDSFEHINNAVYANLLEDARYTAHKTGAFVESSASSGSPRMLSIDYLGQPRALEFLDIAAWWDDEAKAIGFEFTTDSGNVVAKAALVPWSTAPRSSI